MTDSGAGDDVAARLQEALEGMIAAGGRKTFRFSSPTMYICQLPLGL